jgi:hypothetical protein
MEEKKTSLGAHTLMYGVGTGIVLVIYTLIMYVANLYLSKTMQYVSFVVLIAGMVIGAIQYRKVALNGFMTYGQAFSVNFLIGLFATIVSILFFFFYIKYINTGMLGELLEQARANIEAKGGNLVAGTNGPGNGDDGKVHQSGMDGCTGISWKYFLGSRVLSDYCHLLKEE